MLASGSGGFLMTPPALTRDLAQLRAALKSARRFVEAQRDLIIESCCLLDKRLRPRLETLEEAAKPDIRRMDRLLARIDRALGRSR